MAGNGAPRYFHRHDRFAAFEKRDHEDAHHIEKGMFLFGGFGHVGGNRADESVTKQNTEKSSYECSGDFVANLFRRAAQSAHADYDSQDCGHDSETR